MKKKYIKLILEVDMEVSDSLFTQLFFENTLKDFILRNAFHNNCRKIRKIDISLITNEEFKS